MGNSHKNGLGKIVELTILRQSFCHGKPQPQFFLHSFPMAAAPEAEAAACAYSAKKDVIGSLSGSVEAGPAHSRLQTYCRGAWGRNSGL